MRLTKVSVREGHANNWPRKIARKHSDLRDAISALENCVDEGNSRFAWTEFIAEREERARAAEAVRIRRDLLALLGDGQSEVWKRWDGFEYLDPSRFRAALDRIIPEKP